MANVGFDERGFSAEFFEFGDKSLPFIVVSARDNDVRSFKCESRKIREDVSD